MKISRFVASPLARTWPIPIRKKHRLVLSAGNVFKQMTRDDSVMYVDGQQLSCYDGKYMICLALINIYLKLHIPINSLVE